MILRNNIEIISAGGIRNIPKLYKFILQLEFDTDGFFNDEDCNKSEICMENKKFRSDMIGNPSANRF